jgi:phosphoribosyl 1,2-cyclic phosphodiesterase
MIRTTFWGVRGSIPAPGPATARIGGNTSCVEVACGATTIVFDSGTGIRMLGQRLLKAMPLDVHLFFSHVHWDHIQGFPFFAPAFVKGNTIHMYGEANSRGTVESAMAGQMEFPNFPVKLNQLASQLVFHDFGSGDVIELAPGLNVTAAAGTHPGGVLAYRVDYEGSAVVYVTDTEHQPGKIDERIVELARGADVFIYDSMYTPEEYDGRADGRSRIGWGHSTFEEGVKIVEAAGAKQYVLFHHDPDQTDDDVADKERRARELFANSICAYEGLTIEV